jgi:predicted DNA-binding protein
MAVSPRRRAVRATKQVNFRLPQAIYQRLSATSRVLDIPQSKLVSSALQVFFDGLPTKDQQLVESILSRRQKP